MKKIIATLLTFSVILTLAACGAEKETSSSASDNTVSTTTSVSTSTEASTETSADTPADEKTMGNKLADMFLKEIAESNDIEAIANTLSTASEMDCMVVAAKEGYLTGFSGDVSGFTKGVQFSPMIGSIPFVGYIFETEDAETLKQTLSSLADPRWNICTEAAETICVTSGNYVFFTMCPGEEDF